MQLQKVGSHKTSVTHHDGTIRVTYHNTEVVTATASQITLNTDGWKTNTTKARMNQAANEFGLRFRVYQKAGEWFVTYKGQVLSFNKEYIVLDR